VRSDTFGGGALRGWNVVVTRPLEQSEGLCALIEAAGGHPLRFPLLAIEPCVDQQRVAGMLQHPEAWDWLIFVSANAVRYAAVLGCRWPVLPTRTLVAAVGRGTADALLACGATVDLQPKAQFNSEALLDAPPFGRVAGQRILIVRGCGGRELLAETLRARGATVDYAEVYRRVPVLAETSSLLRAWREGGVDAVTLTSGEGLHHLAGLLGAPNADLLAKTPLAVMGGRIAAMARDLGCQRLAVATEASDQGLCDALIRLAQSGPT
jgi:uroporphyrinogen-III synthase